MQLNSVVFLLYREDFKRHSCDGSCKRKNRLVPLKAIPTGNPTPLANAEMFTLPVITVDIIRTFPTIPVLVLNRFIFLAVYSRTSISLRKYASMSDNSFNRYDSGFGGAVGLKSG